MLYKEGNYKNYGYVIKEADGMYSLIYYVEGSSKTIDKLSAEEAISEFEQEIDRIEEFKIGLISHLSDAELQRFKKRIEDNARSIKNHLDKYHYIKDDGQLIHFNELYHHSDVIIEVLRSRGYDYNLKLERINCYNGGHFYILWDYNHPFSRKIQIDITDELNKK